MTTTDKLIAEVRRLDAAATKGPWSYATWPKTSDGRQSPSIIADGGYGVLACDGPENGPHSRDAEAITVYRTAAPALADAVEARDRALDALSQFTRTILIEKAKLLPQSADTMLRAHFGLELVDGKWRIRE